jgi:hypothetical protein
MSTPRTSDWDRPRPGGNQFGAGSPTTQQGAGEVPIMAELRAEVVERVLPYGHPRMGKAGTPADAVDRVVADLPLYDDHHDLPTGVER